MNPLELKEKHLVLSNPHFLTQCGSSQGNCWISSPNYFTLPPMCTYVMARSKCTLTTHPVFCAYSVWCFSSVTLVDSIWVSKELLPEQKLVSSENTPNECWDKHKTMELKCFVKRVYFESVSCSIMPDSLRPPRTVDRWLVCPWNSPGKRTGVDCLVPL